MIDYTPKELIDAGFELVEKFRRARKSSTKARLRQQAQILFLEAGFEWDAATFA